MLNKHLNLNYAQIYLLQSQTTANKENAQNSIHPLG